MPFSMRGSTAGEGPHGGGRGPGPRRRGVGFPHAQRMAQLMACLGMVLLGPIAPAAPPDPPTGARGNPVRLTIEGRLDDAPGPIGDRLQPGTDRGEGRRGAHLAGRGASGHADGAPRRGAGPWGRSPLGTHPAARIEAPLSASLRVQAGGQVFQFPLLPLLEGPRRSPSPSPVEVAVEPSCRGTACWSPWSRATALARA